MCGQHDQFWNIIIHAGCTKQCHMAVRSCRERSFLDMCLFKQWEVFFSEWGGSLCLLGGMGAFFLDEECGDLCFWERYERARVDDWSRHF